MKQQEPIIISKTQQIIRELIPARNYLKKKVYSTSGNYVGVVKDVYMKEGSYVGLLIKGKELLYIDKNYCEPETVDTLILTIEPITMLKRKIVFDSNGKRLGKITSLKRTGPQNTCDELYVKKDLFTKPRPIPYADVDVAKKNVILKKAYDDW